MKFIGGAIIVAAAAFIMFPGFLAVAWGLGKIFLLIVIAGGACLALAYTTRALARRNASRQDLPPASAQTQTENNPM